MHKMEKMQRMQYNRTKQTLQKKVTLQRKQRM